VINIINMNLPIQNIFWFWNKIWSILWLCGSSASIRDRLCISDSFPLCPFYQVIHVCLFFLHSAPSKGLHWPTLSSSTKIYGSMLPSAWYMEAWSPCLLNTTEYFTGAFMVYEATSAFLHASKDASATFTNCTCGGDM
jgi:hypothetical protein